MSCLCQLLKERGEFEPIVIVGKRGDGTKELVSKGVKCYHIHLWNWVVKIEDRRKLVVKIKMLVKLILNILSELHVYLIVKKESIEIIHINDIHSYVGARTAIRMKLGLIWHIRVLLDEDQGLKLYSPKCYELINKSDKVIAISEAVFDHFSKHINSTKMTVVYNGVDEKKFYNPKKTIFSNELIKIMHCGQMNGFKGHLHLIDAIKYLVDEGITNLHVTFVGSGYYEKEYEQYVQSMKLHQYISFSGYHDHVETVFYDSDIFVMNSNAEAFGRVTIEAMMAGCLVVATNSGASSELIKKGAYGVLVPKDNSADLAEALRRIIISHKREEIRIAKAAQKYAMEAFKASINADSIAKCYRLLSFKNDCSF